MLRKTINQRPYLAIALVALLYILVLVVPQVILYGAGVEDPLTFIICFLLEAGLWFLVMPILLHLPGGERRLGSYLEQIGLGRTTFRARFWGLGLQAFGLCFLGFLIAVVISGQLQPDLKSILPPQSWMVLWGLKAGIFEEIAVRGVILLILLRRFAPSPALWISSVLFGMGHALTILLGNPVPDTLVQVLYATLGGVFFGYLFMKTGSLIPGIVAHYLVDALIGLLIQPLFAQQVAFLTRSTALLTGWGLSCLLLLGLFKFFAPGVHPVYPRPDALMFDETGEIADWVACGEAGCSQRCSVRPWQAFR